MRRTPTPADSSDALRPASGKGSPNGSPSANGSGPDPDHLSAALGLRSWLEAIARISAAVNNMEPLTNVLNAIAATTCGLVGYRFGAVLLVDDDGERLLMRGSHGLSSAYIESINSTKPIRLGHGPYGEGPSSRAFRSHAPVMVRDYREDPSVGPWAGVAFEQGFRSMVAVPLIVSGRAIGTLTCYTTEVHEFGQDELLLLSTIANQAAIAIEAGRLRDQERATIARLEEARRSLETQASILERSEAIHTQLTRTVLDGSGLQAIAEALTKVLGGSVVIEDGALHVLATARFEAIEPEVPPAVADDPDLQQLMVEIVAGQEPRELSAAEHRAFTQRTFVAPVVIGRETVARLWVLGAESELQALERRALEHGVTVVALELLKERIASEVEGRLRGELLDDLLSNRTLDPQPLRLRAQHLGHDLSARHAALAIAFDPAPAGSPAPDNPVRNRSLLGLVSSVARRLRCHALTGERDGRIVILLAEPRPGAGIGADELAETIRRDVRSYLAGTVTIAVGPWVSDTPSFPRSYRIARGALELAQQAGRDRTVRVADLGIYGLLLSVDRLEELRAFALRTLDPLRLYDERKGSELVATLRAYLANSCRTAQTSSTLVVHPNTVAYRIRRIETLLDVDLSRPEAQLQLQLALIVDEIVTATPQDATPS